MRLGAPFRFETTNQQHFKPFKINGRRAKSRYGFSRHRKAAEAEKSFCFPEHFKTYNQVELSQKIYRPPAVDLIPYP